MALNLGPSKDFMAKFGKGKPSKMGSDKSKMKKGSKLVEAFAKKK